MAKEIGILMSAPNVLALLARRKSRTMRPIKPQPNYMKRHGETDEEMNSNIIKRARYQPGDMLYVKEGYQVNYKLKGVRQLSGIYLADGEQFICKITENEYKLWSSRRYPYRKTPGRFMYKSLARLWFPCTKVTVQRPQELSEEECVAEGCIGCCPTIYTECSCGGQQARQNWQELFISVYGQQAWDANELYFVTHWPLDEIKVKGN